MPSTEFFLLPEEQREFARAVAARWPEVRWIASISGRPNAEVLVADERSLRLTSVDEVTSWDFVEEGNGRVEFWLWHPELGPGPPVLPAYGRCWFDPAEAGTVEWDPSVVYTRTAPDHTDMVRVLVGGRVAMNKKSDYEYVGFAKYDELRAFYEQVVREARRLTHAKVECYVVYNIYRGEWEASPWRMSGTHVGAGVVRAWAGGDLAYLQVSNDLLELRIAGRDK